MSRSTVPSAVPTALALAGLLALAGCSTPAATPTEATTTDIPTVTIVSGQSAQNGELLQAIFDRVDAAAGRDAVDLEMSNDSDVDTAQRVLLDISAGKGPDAVRVTNATYLTLIDAGVAQPADTCLASDPGLRSELDQDLLDGITVDGAVYQVPWYVTPNALFYNADIFREAGLDPDDPPSTMSGFHQAASAIAALGSVAGGVAYFGNDYNFQGYVASLGGRVYDPTTAQLGIGSDAAAAVFDGFAEMAADGSSPIYTNFFAESNEAFAAGRLGMFVSSASAYPALAGSGAFDLRLAPVPSMDGGEPVGVTSTNGFVITTTDPARQAAVCDALLELVTPETVTETVSATATIPLNVSTVDDEAYLAPVYEENPDWVAVRDQPLVAWQSLPGGASAEYTSAYVDTQLKALRGDLSGADAAAELQSVATGLLPAR